MTTNKELQKATEIALAAHEGVERRNGDLYFNHVMRVANNRKFILDKTAQVAAVLHDVIEDSPITAEYLLQKGISREVVTVLSFLTHDKENVSYEDYIKNITNNLTAMLVKLSDLEDNSDTETLDVITDKDIARFVQYENAKRTIMTVLLEKYPETFKIIKGK